MEKVSIPYLQKKKSEKIPIVSITCYDAFSSRLIDQAGVDIALVGDSLANTRLGYPTTLPVTLNEMIHHVRAAARGVQRAFLVADMPFQSYEAAPWEAAIAAGRFIKEGHASAVKLEGGERVADSVKAIIKANVPVMGHLGLTPQSFHQMGGYKVQGREKKEAAKILSDAKLLEKLGVFALVLEGIPSDLARKITKQLRIPTIGIGAGPHCDGQILVLDDLLGMGEGLSPKFVAKYANLRPVMNSALKKFADDVRRRQFPKDSHSYH